MSETTFQMHIAELWKATQGRPKDPAVYALPTSELVPEESFPLQLEMQLAKSFAYIAGVKRGVECVSAAAVERSRNVTDGLTINLASNNQIRPEVEQRLKEIALIMQDAAADSELWLLSSKRPLTLSELSRNQCKESLQSIILRLNMFRISDRLRSRKGSQPVVLNGLGEILKRIQSPDVRIQHPRLIARIETLCTVLRRHNGSSKQFKQIQYIREVVTACHSFCSVVNEEQIKTMLMEAGVDLDKARGDPTIRQIYKIAAYHSIAETLSSVTSKQGLRQYFLKTSIRCISAYTTTQIVIAHAADGGDRSCRVHAEIQLVVDMDRRSDSEWLRPRVICSGKAACFLCELFINQHGSYFVPETHGKLSPHWTIPDLIEYTPFLRGQYRGIIRAMNDEISRLTRISHPKRLDAAMSWLGLSQLQLQSQTYVADKVGNLEPTQLLDQIMIGPKVHEGQPSRGDTESLDTPKLIATTSISNLQDCPPITLISAKASSTQDVRPQKSKTGELNSSVMARSCNTSSQSIALYQTWLDYSMEQHKPAQVLSSTDLSGGRSKGKIMRDHGSRTRDSLPTCITEESHVCSDTARDTCMMQAGSESRWIDLHEIELLIEFERSTKAFKTSRCAPIETQISAPVVDISDLPTDNEVTVSTDTSANLERSLFLVLPSSSGKTWWWRISWQN